MKAKKWMTLLELLIVMAILGILFVLLLRTYNWISTMVFRVQQEKEVAQEVMQISQIIQNFADRNSIDYSKYLVTSNEWPWRFEGRQVTRLVDTKWITEVLYLSGQDGEVVIYSSGNCIDPAAEMVYRESWSDCSLYIDVGGKTREIINTKKISISKVVFKVIPFASEQQYISDPSLCDGIYLQCLNSPGFRMIFGAYSPNYGTQWATRVHVPFQQFF